MEIVYIHPQQPQDREIHRWRCLIPAEAVFRTGRHQANLLSLKEFISHSERAEQLCRAADLLVIQHNLIGPALSQVQHWKARDKTIILDIQKTKAEMSAGAPGYRQWIQSLQNSGAIPSGRLDPPGPVQLEWALKLVHGATAASRQLEREWRRYAPRYLPSYINVDDYSNVSRDTMPGTVIGWVFSPDQNSITADHPVHTALRHICQREPTIQVHCLGMSPKSFQTLPVPPRQKWLIPRETEHRWANQLSRIDIGILPRQLNSSEHFLRIRILEFMVMKIPWVSSDPAVGSRLQELGRMIEDCPEDWILTLNELTAQGTQDSSAGGQNSYLYGISQHIDDHVDSLLEIYRGFHATAKR